MTWRRVLLLSMVGVVLVAGADPALARPRQPGNGRRLLVLSLPTLTWDELFQGRTPHLDALVGQSASAGMSVRNVLPLTDAADGYATMSAGTRARGVDQSGQVLQVDEDFLGTPAGVAAERNTGLPARGGLVSFGFADIVRRNGRLAYAAHPGALGAALSDAGVPRAVIANADGIGLTGGPIFARAAGTALVDEDGRVEGGATSRALLEDDASAPFGVRYSIEAVIDAFRPAWANGGVVLVEGSDLVRVDRYTSTVESDRREPLALAALEHTDALVGTLLDEVDAAQDAVLLVAPYHASGQAQVTVAALRAPDIEPGVLESASTRRAGLVTLVDIAPTILDLAGVAPPSSMEGRPFERVRRGAATAEARAQGFAQVDEASRYRDDMVAPVAATFVVLQAVLWGAVAFALQRGRTRARRVVSLAALGMLAYLPATYLAGLVPFHQEPSIAYWAFVVVVSVGFAGLASVAGPPETLDPLLLVLTLVFGLLVVDMLVGAPLQLNTVFGYSPTVGGRFAGMGNLAYGQFAGAAFLLSGLLARRLHGRPAAGAVAMGVLVVAIVIDGMPIWGSDVGGVLAFVPAAGVTAATLFGRRLRWRSVLGWGSAAVALVGLFAAIDLSRPSDRRTHLGRLVEAVGDSGLGALETVVTRKLGANLAVITSSVWTAMVPIAFGAIAYLLWRAPGHVRAIRNTIRESLGGLAVVGVLGFALNDSGIAVPGVMLGVINASLVYLAVRALPDDPAEPAIGGTT